LLCSNAQAGSGGKRQERGVCSGEHRLPACSWRQLCRRPRCGPLASCTEGVRQAAKRCGLVACAPQESSSSTRTANLGFPRVFRSCAAKYLWQLASFLPDLFCRQVEAQHTDASQTPTGCGPERSGIVIRS